MELLAISVADAAVKALLVEAVAGKEADVAKAQAGRKQHKTISNPVGDYILTQYFQLLAL